MKSNSRRASKGIVERHAEAKLSNYFQPIENIKPGPVVLVVRVSSRSQKDNQNLDNQESRGKAILERLGFTVVKVFRETVPGWKKMFKKDVLQRSVLRKAFLLARKLGCPVVAESADRFRRRWVRDWKDRRKQLPLRVRDVERLMQEADGVCLVTLVHPDEPHGTVRSHQTKRGQSEKNRKGGRQTDKTPKKRYRKMNFSKARWMRLLKMGGRGTIEKMTGVPVGTQRRWELRKCA
jgi:Resolvase, N terminal domain